MSSDSTIKKLRLKNYLRTYGAGAQQLQFRIQSSE
jgi:hypothetical protein